MRVENAADCRCFRGSSLIGNAAQAHESALRAQLRGGETTVDEDGLFALHVSQLQRSDAMGADSLEVLEEAMAERMKALNSLVRGERI